MKQYQIDLDPIKLRAYNIPLQQVVGAVERSNNNVGAKVMEVGDTEDMVRGIGLIRGLKDIEDISLAAYNGIPVTVGNVASVQLGPEFRRGVLDKDGREAVGGVVVIRYGANAREVIAAIKQKIEEIQPGLPAGVHIVPFYDRSILIGHAVDTLKHALIEEIILVTLAHILFLWHFRSILVVTIPLPLAVLGAFLFMKGAGISSNIMSLGGIAIAIGVPVDAGIVMTENVIRHAEQYETEHGNYRDHIWEITLGAAKQVGRPITFAMVIIILAFVPVFALTGMEGKMFHPLAFTKTLAMIGSTILAITLVPVLCTFLIRGKLHREEDNPIMRVLRAIYRPTLSWALRHRALTLTAALALPAAALYTATTIGSEFMPPLDEETALFMPITDPCISLTAATRSCASRTASSLPIRRSLWSSAKSAAPKPPPTPPPSTCPKPPSPSSSRTSGPKARQRTPSSPALDDQLQIPGVTNIWTQPIRNRIDMLSTGIRTQIGIKVFGPDLRVIEQLSGEIKQVVQQIPGAADLYAERTTGAPYLEMTVDRAKPLTATASTSATSKTRLKRPSAAKTTHHHHRRPPAFPRPRPPLRTRLPRWEPAAARGTCWLRLGTAHKSRSARSSKFHHYRPLHDQQAKTACSAELSLLNVRGRDVGGFVDARRRAVAPTSRHAARLLRVEWSWSVRERNQRAPAP